MKKRKLFFISLCALIGLGICSLWLMSKKSVEAQYTPQDAHPLKTINQKAKIARNGGLNDSKDLSVN